MSEINKLGSKRRLCGHCNEEVSKTLYYRTLYYRHRQQFYDEQNKKWCKTPVLLEEDPRTSFCMEQHDIGMTVLMVLDYINRSYKLKLTRKRWEKILILMKCNMMDLMKCNMIRCNVMYMYVYHTYTTYNCLDNS